jgi:N-acyl-D-amino-acid deacylase
MYQLLIKNSLVIDGSGRKAEMLDVAVESGRIVAVQKNITTRAATMVDAGGMVLAPGFIDCQNHSDSYWQLFTNPSLDSLIAQGYTTILVGSSGTSLAPLISEESFRSIQKWVPTTGLNVNWRSFAEYSQQLSSMQFGCNILSMVGYSTIRRGLLNDSKKIPDQAELDSLLALIESSFTAGAAGVSVGLQYSHEFNVTTEELTALATLCAKHNKLLSVSMRDEGAGVIASCKELLALAEQTKVNLKISHLKIRHRSNWPLLTELLDTIEAARHKGVNVHFDCYPYTETWQPLYTYLPNWSLEGGRTHLLERLAKPEDRQRILSSLTNHAAHLPALVVASTSAGLKANGKSIGSLAKDMGLTSEETILNLVEHGGSSTLVFDDCLDLGTVNILCNHALGFVATNGGGFDLALGEQLVHPRSFGTSPRFLRQVIDSKAISLEEAVAKLTSRVATALNLSRKGQIITEYDADLVLFDPATVNSLATTSNPYQFPNGIEAVWVAGELAAQKSRPTGVLAGRYLA